MLCVTTRRVLYLTRRIGISDLKSLYIQRVFVRKLKLPPVFVFLFARVDLPVRRVLLTWKCKLFISNLCKKLQKKASYVVERRRIDIHKIPKFRLLTYLYKVIYFRRRKDKKYAVNHVRKSIYRRVDSRDRRPEVPEANLYFGTLIKVYIFL